jgi:Fe-S-cluster containining protein
MARTLPEGTRRELYRIYAEVDALLEGASCDASTDCCRFGVTGREPYLTAVEIAELERASRARGGIPKRRRLPVAGERRCAFLSDEGRCWVYDARPFGCRTFFCDRAVLPGRSPRAAIARLTRDLSALAEGFARDAGGARPMCRVFPTGGR